MKIIGIICEYNPFHNGHLYHIERIKELFPDSLIVLVLGSYFLERGDISLISKWNKTSIALDNGVNIVVELPTLKGTNSADIFADTAIKILSKFSADKIVFGSETADIKTLKELAVRQNDTTFNDLVRKHLKDGDNYPTSLSKALGMTSESNDILGIAYIKAIQNNFLNIEPVAIRRTNDFSDTTLDAKIVSAQNIRERLRNCENISKYIPNYDRKMINKIDEELLFKLIRYKIITDENLNSYLGVDEGLENRLKKVILKADSYESLIDLIKSKRYTTSRIKRMLIHILLGIEKKDIEEELDKPRVLGFDSKGREYLKSLEGKYRTGSSNDEISNIEKKAALIYYDLTHDESIKREFLNCPIIK